MSNIEVIAVPASIAEQFNAPDGASIILDHDHKRAHGFSSSVESVKKDMAEMTESTRGALELILAFRSGMAGLYEAVQSAREEATE